jgi:hypothetical protein
MSDRVSHHEWQIGPERWVVDSEFARKLEEEIGQLRERIEMLEELVTGERWTDPKEAKPEHAADAKALGEVLRIVEAKP